MCKRNLLSIIAVAILALAIGPVQAVTVTVPNGSFEEVYKPGSVVITADLGGGWTNGVGDTPEDTAPMEAGQTVTYSDATTGTSVYVPGWINTPGWPVSYTWPEGCGSIAGQTTPSDGVYYYTANGGGWGNSQGGTIVSDAPLDYAKNGTYTLSMVANGSALPIVLELLADGEALTPSSIDDPGTYTWSTVTKTYDPSSLAGHIGKALTIQIGVGSDATGDQSHFDSVTLDFVSGDPTIPDVDAGPDMITWSGQKVELDPNVVNNHVPPTPLIYLWTANPATGVVFDPSAEVEDPNVTITKPATVTTAVAITNPGFETPVLADGGYTVDFTNCPGWSNVDAQTSGGVWNPGLVGYTGYGGNAPEGQNVAYVNSSGIKQVLTKTFAVDTTYTLTVKVGNNADPGLTWTGYKVQLLAGETVIAEDNNTLTPAVNTFETSTVTYTYDPCDSALLGQALQIRLLCLGEGGEADFDDVQLTAEAPTPVPYVVTLVLKVNNDGEPPEKTGTGALKIYVYDDACEAARIGKDLAVENLGDFNEDCITDANDLDELAAKWLTGDALTVPIPKP
jgi:hypothetical protein